MYFNKKSQINKELGRNVFNGARSKEPCLTVIMSQWYPDHLSSKNGSHISKICDPGKRDVTIKNSSLAIFETRTEGG